MTRGDTIPVVDLFAGPGGLGEGFAAYRDSSGARPFSLAISIEKDAWAHETLRLRAFKRRFEGDPPIEYQRLLEGELEFAQLVEAHPKAGRAAELEACRLELNEKNAGLAYELVRTRVSQREPWVLIGGPPCQAYSLIGRARNKGNAGYSPEADHRQTLYIEYLQVLADHAPHAFVMENVKGLLSATLSGEKLFERIREDLENPAAAIRREGRTAGANQPRYTLRALADAGSRNERLRATDFIVRSEEFGVPQARHRVIILGVRSDLAQAPARYLTPHFPPSTVAMELAYLPRLRSGLSANNDSGAEWSAAIRAIPNRRWFREASTELQHVIRTALESLTIPRAGRGANVQWRRKPRTSLVLNHSTRAHIPDDLERYFFAASFARLHQRSPDLTEFPTTLLPNHVSAQSSVGGKRFSDRFRVQLGDRPSTTITSHIAKDGHYYIHFDPSQCRSLTVREAARLQTFPDDYFFCGPRTAQYQQVGNAVPPGLAEQIARVVAALLGR